VLRLVLELDGEVVERVDPHIGLLHRGTEKLIEAQDLSAGDALFRPARLFAPMNQEHAFCLAIEKLLGIEVPRGQLIRVLYSEIGRILSHLLNVTTQAMDVGALTPPLWGFEEREKLMVFYERASARACTPIISAPAACIRTCRRADRRHRRMVRSVPERLDDLDGLLTENRIFKQRNVDIGVVTLEQTLEMGLLRRDGARLGRAWDLRKSQPYECYERWISTSRSARTATATTATCIRMEEMRQSACAS
jgi:NADH-quinone oxidoreductase subunit D